MSTVQSGLEESPSALAGDGQVAEERTADGDEVRTGDSDPDPLALDPVSPIPLEPGRAQLAGPLALDPLSTIGRDATRRHRADPRRHHQQQEGTS
jgi:hypothetical protein